MISARLSGSARARRLRSSPSSALAITVAIFSQPRTFGSNIDIIGPATFVSLIIPLAVFFAFQRYFVQGRLAGSVK